MHTKNEAIKLISGMDSVLKRNGVLSVVPFSIYSQFSPLQLVIYGHFNGYYCFPTIELADWLRSNFDLSNAIEIGAGHGALSRHLNIPATDSKLMDDPEIRLYYQTMGQPVTTYPEDIIKLDAIEAIDHYKPSVVIGCWVTHKYREDEHERGGNYWGIDEDEILSKVDTYIVIGNKGVHGKKRILSRPHKEYWFSWLCSRSQRPQDNIIYVWNKLHSHP
jgi:hypothetical protein